MFKGLLTAIAMTIAGAATAQDISIPMDQVGRGSTITIQTSAGDVFTNHILGQSGLNEYSYAVYSGPDTSGPPAWVTYTDSSGNVTSRVNAQGGITTFTPHRCNRIVGPCTYTETRPDGARLAFTRITTLFTGGFTYLLYNEADEVTVIGSATIGELGWTQRGSNQRTNEAAVSFETVSARFR